jgi:CheY-like chemotaxis protein
MRSVLIVDDSPALARGVAGLLQSASYRTHVVFDGAAALVFLQRCPVDLMILDLQMPGMSGIDVLKALRESRTLPDVAKPAPPPPPIIVFSLHDGWREEALELGAVAYVSKADLADLLPLVEKHARISAETLTG